MASGGKASALRIDGTRRETGGASRWSVLGGLTLVTFLLLADDTAVSVAVPTIQTDLGAGFVSISWVVKTYTLAVAAFTLLAGRLADRNGARPIFLLGLAVFVLGSLLGGLAPNAAVLIAARGVQGLGAALVAPAALALIASTFPDRERGVAIGIWSGVSASALGAGPLFGAIITDWVGWPWIFLVNVPLGAGAWLLARFLLPRSTHVRTGGGVDLPGVALSAVALVALVMSLGLFEDGGWASPGFLALLLVSFASALLFIARERRARLPLVDLRLFRSRSLTGANLVTLLSTAVMCSLFFFLALYLQTVAGLSALAAGGALLPLTLSIVVVAPIAGRLADRFGNRLLIVVGMLALAVALLGLGTLGLRSGGIALAAWLALAGIGIGIARTPTTSAALSGADGSAYGMAAGILNTAQATGLALGIAVMSVILTSFGPNAAFDRTLDAAHHEAFVDGLTAALAVNAGIAAAAALLAAVLLGPRAPRPADRCAHC
ncbi:MFS transporter [Microbacterium sp. Mu-80]|uniref:MFS transporter n=1 Tax=Microbacterium bandirmense TaxID=3122050 RepID=A0ABU8L8R6_9MICO